MQFCMKQLSEKKRHDDSSRKAAGIGPTITTDEASYPDFSVVHHEFTTCIESTPTSVAAHIPRRDTRDEKLRDC
jgi:hypothetical protein